MALPKVTFASVGALPKWICYEHAEMHVPVVADADTGQVLVAFTDPKLATLFMAIPQLLQFCASFARNHPCRIDVDRVLSHANIEIGHPEESRRKDGYPKQIDD